MLDYFNFEQIVESASARKEMVEGTKNYILAVQPHGVVRMVGIGMNVAYGILTTVDFLWRHLFSSGGSSRVSGYAPNCSGECSSSHPDSQACHGHLWTCGCLESKLEANIVKAWNRWQCRLVCGRHCGIIHEQSKGGKVVSLETQGIHQAGSYGRCRRGSNLPVRKYQCLDCCKDWTAGTTLAQAASVANIFLGQVLSTNSKRRQGKNGWFLWYYVVFVTLGI